MRNIRTLYSELGKEEKIPGADSSNLKYYCRAVNYAHFEAKEKWINNGQIRRVSKVCSQLFSCLSSKRTAIWSLKLVQVVV